MPWLTVSTDEGTTTMRERVLHVHAADEHFRRCLAERIAWAVDDAADIEASVEDRQAEPARARLELVADAA